MRAERASKPPRWAGDVQTGVSAWLGDEGRSGHHDEGNRGPVRGDPVPEDPLQAGPDADPESVARTILLDQLTGRARSRRELADKLRSRNVPEEIATRLLDRFTEVGLVDDGAFARQWVESRQASRGLARRALSEELRRKGIDTEVAREALDQLEPGAEREAARGLVRKRLPAMRRLDRATATRRLTGMLARKGYPPGLAFAVVREELGSEGDEDGPGGVADALDD